MLWLCLPSRLCWVAAAWGLKWQTAPTSETFVSQFLFSFSRTVADSSRILFSSRHQTALHCNVQPALSLRSQTLPLPLQVADPSLDLSRSSCSSR